MSVSATSQAAYADIKGKLGEKQQAVFDTIKEIGPASNEMIAEHLDWAINRVTGRTNELNRFGVIKVHGLTVGKSGKSAKTWVDADSRLNVIKSDEPLRAVSWLYDERAY